MSALRDAVGDARKEAIRMRGLAASHSKFTIKGFRILRSACTTFALVVGTFHNVVFPLAKKAFTRCAVTAQVKKEAESFLRSMAKELAQTPEIRTLADDIITSILEPRFSPTERPERKLAGRWS